MAGDKSLRPAEIDKMSGIYSVVHDDGNGTFEMTCVEAEQFQPIRTGKGHAMS
jgi:Zn-dependent M32 family carboxypeptidase